MRVDGELTGLSVSLRDCLERTEGTFQKLVFNDISSFTEEDGQWYYRTQGGIMLEEWGPGIIQYETGVEMIAPVIYSEGIFSLGEITLREISGE